MSYSSAVVPDCHFSGLEPIILSLMKQGKPTLKLQKLETVWIMYRNERFFNLCQFFKLWQTFHIT